MFEKNSTFELSKYFFNHSTKKEKKDGTRLDGNILGKSLSWENLLDLINKEAANSRLLG